MGVATAAAGSASAGAVPLRGQNYLVEFANTEHTLSASKISGGDATISTSPYRAGDSSLPYVENFPGMIAFSILSASHAMFENKIENWNWLEDIALAGTQLEKDTMTISLLDADLNTVLAVWQALGVFIYKISGVDLTGDSSNIVIETVEFSLDNIGRTQ
ncbi:MAG: phage tail protein [Oscillospiraceae bacterium]|jgi:phage tail-like protein|nr:phage tail protein [Oscillospiraceae bacterium]